MFLPRMCYEFFLRMYFIEPGRSLKGQRNLDVFFEYHYWQFFPLYACFDRKHAGFDKNIFSMHYLGFLLYFLGNIFVMLCTYSSFCLWNIKTSAILSWNLYNPSNFMQHALSDVMWNTNLTLKSFLSSRSNLSQGKITSSKSFWSHVFTFLSSYFYFENDSN